MLAGLQAWQQLPIDAFPDISPTQAKIILKIPGMTPEEVDRFLAAQAVDARVRRLESLQAQADVIRDQPPHRRRREDRQPHG